MRQLCQSPGPANRIVGLEASSDKEHISVHEALRRIMALCENPHWTNDRHRIYELADAAIQKLDLLKNKGIPTGEDELDARRNIAKDILSVANDIAEYFRSDAPLECYAKNISLKLQGLIDRTLKESE